jgi:hypothetical protein
VESREISLLKILAFINLSLESFLECNIDRIIRSIKEVVPKYINRGTVVVLLVMGIATSIWFTYTYSDCLSSTITLAFSDIRKAAISG